MMELGDDYFAAEEARLSTREMKAENGHGEVKDEDEDTKEGIIKEEVPMEDSDDETPLARRKKPQKRKSEWDEDSEDEPLSKKKAKKKGPELPRYKGPEPPPNRFKLWPGYRWDGVDRSNGFEKKIYSRANAQKAMKEIAYKWSTEDM